MKLLFSVTLISLTLIGCTKNRLERFNNQIIGNWQLTEINKFGLGSSHIVFDGGHFSFKSDNSAAYYDRFGNAYYGSWFIDTYTYIDDDGDSNTDFILTINVSNTHSNKFDVFEIPSFGNTNRFKAKVKNELNTVTYVFERR